MASVQPTGAQAEFVFPPFRLDLRNEQLFEGDSAIPLRPKTYAVLRCLIDRRGQLVTKDEILEAVWPGVSVSDSVLKVCVREIREALRDETDAPRFVETAHRRGYRFIATVLEETTARPTLVRSVIPVPPLVGRSGELARLKSRLGDAISGSRIIVFITGEPGIGKTALVEALIGDTAGSSALLVGRGHCVEHYGGGEAYLPVLAALSHLCRGPEGERIVTILARCAPTWLAQMPAIARPQVPLDGLRPAGSPARMLREMADAIEAITADTPMLLALEDLHWSDASTIDLIAYLAGRRERARLMIVGTYRPAEANAVGHPLRGAVQELLAHRACDEQRLAHLDEDAVADYLGVRFPGHRIPRDHARVLHRHTGGNPLFMVSVVDYLVECGALSSTPGAAPPALELRDEDSSVPDTVRGVIDRQIDLLDAYARTALEVASVAGPQFTVAEVAAALADDEIVVEAAFESLARHQHFLHRETPMELPDGTLTTRFGFVHALHHGAFYGRVPLARRTELHHRIGNWLEQRSGDRARELAPVLAMHFEQGRDHQRAVRYCRMASEIAQQRFAIDEAIRLATRGLTLLEKTWPRGLDRDREELALRLALGVPLLAARGFAASEVERTYLGALDLSNRLGDASVTLAIIAGLYGFYLVRAELATARRLSQQLLDQASTAQDVEMLLHAHWTALVSAVNEGDFLGARDHFEKAVRLFGRASAPRYLTRFGQDAETACRAFGAWALWSLGDTERALNELRTSQERASSLAHAHSLCFSHFFAAFIAQMRGDPVDTLREATLTQRLALEHGFPQWIAFGTILRGWARAVTGEAEKGMTEIREGLAAYEATGAAISRPHFMALQAEAMAESGQADEALRDLLDAIAEARRTGGRYYESELLRIEAETRLMRRSAGDQSVASLRLEEAVDVARRQGAVPFERRARKQLTALRRTR